MNIKAPRGTTDLYSPELERWQRVEATARDLFRLFGFQEIRTPILEEAALFSRSVGDQSEIVQKQMISFLDRGERLLALRPEGTASVVRAYIERHLDQRPGIAKLFYIGPMFRAERPQAGRSRQFHQIGAEGIGSYRPHLDAEMLQWVWLFFERLGLSGAQLKINSLGCQKDKKGLEEFLRQKLVKEKEKLCKECQTRFEKNVFRVLDCKNKECRAVCEKLPPFFEKLCGECQDHFRTLQRFLRESEIPFVEDPHLVRGLDYYTRTAFEITHKALGAQDAIGAGGRYDTLVESLGGPVAGAVGFAIGFERLLMALGPSLAPKEEGVQLFLTTVGEGTFEMACGLLPKLRRLGIPALLDFEGRSLKSQMRLANHYGVRWVLLLGEEELKTGHGILKEMAQGEEQRVSLDDLEKLCEIVGEKRG